MSIRPKALRRLVHQAPEIVLRRNIGRDRLRRFAPARAIDGGRGFGAGLRLPRRDDHRRAMFGHALGDRPADAARGAGDDRHPAGEVEQAGQGFLRSTARRVDDCTGSRDMAIRYEGVGAPSGSSPSRFRSRQSPAGMGWLKFCTFCRTCSGLIAPGMTEATIGWASGNWSAAAARGAPWALQIAWMRSTFAIDLFRGVGIIILRPGNPPGRGDSGIVHAADHDAHSGALAIGKFRFQNVLLHQRVAERDEKEIEPDRIEKPRHHSEFVDARPDAAHEPVRAQLFERPPSGAEELAEMGRDLRLGGMEPEVEVMNDEKIDAAHPEPHLRLLVRAHEPVISVVVHMIEAQAPGPGRWVERVGIDGREEPAADLGREDEFRPRLPVEEAAIADLAQAPAIVGRGVEIAYAGVPRRVERRGGGRFVDLHEQFAERRSAESKLRHLDASLSEAAGLGRVHRVPPSSGNFIGPRRPRRGAPRVRRRR